MDGSGYGRIGDALGKAVIALAAVVCITVPLAIWKIIDGLIWLFS